jgi:hypothetical protein
MMGLIVMGTAFYCPPLKWLLRKFVLPAPGQGPSEAFMDTGFLKITGFATGTNGTKLKSIIYFPTDPGYRDTVSIFNTLFSCCCFTLVDGLDCRQECWLNLDYR